MKRSVSLILLISILLTGLVSCFEPNERPEDTTDVTEETTSGAGDVTEDPGEGFVPSSLTVTPDKLNLEAVVVRGGEDLVTAEITDDGAVKLTSAAVGECLISCENKYSESAKLTVRVDEKGNIEYSCDPFVKPERSVNVNDFGALGNDATDDTASIQKAIDSLGEGGGTVYIPKGLYYISYLEFREGVHIRLEGNLPDAKVGFTGDTKKYASASNIAILKSNDKNSHLFYNLKKGSYCTEGVSNISLSGGMLDCITKRMAFVFACGDNIRVENCIIKDIDNNHALQIGGCSNVTVKNVMFAGYTFNGTLTRETIQIECTTPGAISSNLSTTPVKCNDGDFHYGKNVVVTGCYFGKSDISGPHLTPLGHHGTNGPATYVGVEFSDNVVDNPLMYGLHLINNTNIKVVNNTFISTSYPGNLAGDSALINFYTKSSDLTYTDQSGIKVTYSCNTEQDGIKNAVIENNTFILGGRTCLKAIYIAGTSFSNGAVYRSGIIRNEGYGTTAKRFSGYVKSTNIIENVTIRNNNITVKDKITYSDAVIVLSDIFGLTIENNEISGAEFTKKYNDQSGIFATSVLTPKEAKKRCIDANPDGTVYLRTEKGSVEYKCLKAGRLTLEVKGEGTIGVRINDGDVSVTVTPSAGYEFAGWEYRSGDKVDLSAGFGGDTTICAVFKQK